MTESSREIHEKQIVEVLGWLRKGHAIEKIGWELKYKKNGCRLAPAISQLSLAYGLDIQGSGVPGNGYRLVNIAQYPTRNKVTSAFKIAYYDSLHWDCVRNKRFKKDGHACVLCDAVDDIQCHHVTYDLFNEALSDLMTVCRDCHSTIHSSGRIAFPDGAKVEHFERLSIECCFEPWLTKGSVMPTRIKQPQLF